MGVAVWALVVHGGGGQVQICERAGGGVQIEDHLTQPCALVARLHSRIVFCLCNGLWKEIKVSKLVVQLGRKLGFPGCSQMSSPTHLFGSQGPL